MRFFKQRKSLCRRWNTSLLNWWAKPVIMSLSTSMVGGAVYCWIRLFFDRTLAACIQAAKCKASRLYRIPYAQKVRVVFQVRLWTALAFARRTHERARPNTCHVIHPTRRGYRSPRRHEKNDPFLVFIFLTPGESKSGVFHDFE